MEADCVTTQIDTEVAASVPAVLFADVSGWTDLTSRVGDRAALSLRDGLFGPLKEIIRQYRGWLVKTIGDELMCLFDSAQDAARAARDMQLYAERANSRASEPLPLRIGMHAGHVVMKDDDIEGNTVNVAARVAAASKPERILMTRATAERLDEDLSQMLRQWRSEAFKGKEESFELFELNWRREPEERTTVSRPSGSAAARLGRLTLRCQGHVRVLEPGGRALTFGRARHNALVIADPGHYVSGSHGKIEIRGGHLVLTDNSRNGIFISFGRGQFFLVDQPLVLRGSGCMALGRAPDEPGVIVAEFELG
ncbi:MAG TPA: adenylate/guanylate cyclase domain-containing protein [Burkholderiales bacterium]|nr:adenylate/guanylate cyclase domain-containing protein [Burkholderiales bacterium]